MLGILKQRQFQDAALGDGGGGTVLTASISSLPLPTGISTVLAAAMAATSLLPRAANTERAQGLVAERCLEAMQPAGLMAPWIIATLRSVN